MKKKEHSVTIPMEPQSRTFVAGDPYLIYPEHLNKAFFTSHYNYRCGKCGGEFNMPIRKDNKWYCPFCGAEMLGMN